jgi:hypothetical protein
MKREEKSREDMEESIFGVNLEICTVASVKLVECGLQLMLTSVLPQKMLEKYQRQKATIAAAF